MFRKDWRTNLVCESFCKILVLASLCYLCYGNSLYGSFVFDDTVAIKQNKAILQDPTNYTAIFTSDFWGVHIKNDDSHKSYRPLTSLMFHWEWVKWKLEPVHMKTINLLLHFLNSVLVYLFLEKLDFTLSYKRTAFIASILFATHPVHTEAVSGIVSRADLMFCFIYLLCLLISTLRNYKDHWSIPCFVIVLTCLGVLYKETAITIPLACVTISFGINRAYVLPWQQCVKFLFNYKNILYATSTVLILMARLWIIDFKNPKFRKADNPVAHAELFTTRLLSQNYLYAYNLYIFLNPMHLCFDWSFGCLQLVESLKDPRLIIVLCVFGLFILIGLKYKSSIANTIALGLIIVPFLPASGIIKVGFVIAERVLYVPSIGFCYMVANGVSALCDIGNKCKKFTLIGLLIIVFVFVLRSRERSLEWMTEEKLFASALNVCPNNAKVHYNIARLATDIKNNTKAILHYHKAVELSPDYDAALMNLGNLYREMGKLSEAEVYLKKSLKVSPDFATAWMNLGIVQSSLKHYTEALHSYQNALKYRKNYANCYYNMGNLYLDQNLFTEAHRHWQHAVAINPKLQKAWTNMLTMLDSKGMYEDAIMMSQQALQYLPNENSIIFLRANVFGKQGHYIEAEDLYKRVIAKEPMNYLYHTNLAVLYHRWGRLEDAIKSYKKAIESNHQKAITARDNLNKLINRLYKEKSKKNSYI